MKKLILIAALALGGCAATQNAEQLTATAKEIQANIKLACNFVPTIQSIVSIINAGAGATFGIVNEVCNAVTTAPLADGGQRKIVVRGVVVKGKFVR